MMNRLYARSTMFGGTDRACAHCGSRMVIGLDDRRSDARYCSPRCRGRRLPSPPPARPTP